MGAWSWVGLVPEGWCLVETPQWLLLRAVRILLECILVLYVVGTGFTPVSALALHTLALWRYTSWRSGVTQAGALVLHELALWHSIFTARQ